MRESGRETEGVTEDDDGDSVVVYIQQDDAFVSLWSITLSKSSHRVIYIVVVLRSVCFDRFHLNS